MNNFESLLKMLDCLWFWVMLTRYCPLFTPDCAVHAWTSKKHMPLDYLVWPGTLTLFSDHIKWPSKRQWLHAQSTVDKHARGAFEFWVFILVQVCVRTLVRIRRTLPVLLLSHMSLCHFIAVSYQGKMVKFFGGLRTIAHQLIVLKPSSFSF